MLERDAARLVAAAFEAEQTFGAGAAMGMEREEAVE
jgi:hypothetical protein